MKKIAINGFGRIGRMVLRSLIKNHKEKFEIVAINDLTDAQTLAHLFEFDSTYGRFLGDVSVKDDSIIIDKKHIKVFSEKNPENLPWGDLNVDVVLECTGLFRTRQLLQKHINAGAKKVILSAPAKDNIDLTVVLGVNDKNYNPEQHNIISNASCTTNCLAPILKVLNEAFKIKMGLMTTIHSYTGDQNLLDAPHSDLRRSRSATQSIVPTSTGAAKAVSIVIPELEGKLNGMAVRVPTPTVSLVDLTLEFFQEVSVEEINAVLKNASNNELKGILGYEEKKLVSKDFQGDERSSIIDAQSTISIDKKMIKILSWYDNEWGYSCRLADLAIKV